MPTPTNAIIYIALFWLLSYVIKRIRFHRNYKFPNELPGWPLLGNTLQVPYPAGVWSWEKAKKYGEMYSSFECILGTKLITCWVGLL